MKPKPSELKPEGNHHPFCIFTYKNRSNLPSTSWDCTCGLLRKYDAWDTRPKPSVKWPKKDSYNSDWNDAINACQAAVEAGGLKYGLDYAMLEDLFVKHIFVYRSVVKNQNVTIGGWESFKEALKLAERELVVRKEK